MQCHEASRAIPKLIDGLLDHEEDFAVRQHINGCPDCLARLRAFEQDQQALSGYLRRAPYAPVARKVTEEIERSRSPWWDAFMAGSYRLASVAGLVLVLLVVGAGAWMLREVATTDPATDDQPSQEIMVGTTDDADSDQVDQATEPPLIGEDDIGYIVDRLDEHGLVFEANVVSEGDGYTIEYGRIAIDRHFSLVEYRADVTTDEGVAVTYMAHGGGSQPIPVENGEASGWLVFHSQASEADIIELEDGRLDETGQQNSHEFEFDLSALPGPEENRQVYDVSDRANGIELCCLEIEYGIAVSAIKRSWNIVDTDSLIYVDENLQPTDSPLVFDATAPVIYPEVTVDGEAVPVLEGALQRGLNLQGEGYGAYNLPSEGMLEIHFEHIMLPTDEQDGGISIFQGPWTLTAQLEDPAAEPEPTPEPTEPPTVAKHPTPEAEPETTPTPVEDDDEEHDPIRVLVYMVRGDELGASSRVIDHTPDVATASIEALLAGPNYEDEDVGLQTEIPAGTELLDISLEHETLLVDLSEEFTGDGGSAAILMRLAQVVHTGTQFDSVEDVQILIEGQRVETISGEGAMIDEPMSREDFEDQTPAILLETPAPHETVGNEIHLRGTANTFEANLQIEIIDPMGNEVYRDYATATSGTGMRGEFDLTVEVDFEGEGIGAVRLFEHSARDGERINVVTIPVRFEQGSYY